MLHVGCTDAPLTLTKGGEGRLLHQKLEKVASELVGVDVDEPGISIMRNQFGISGLRVDDAETLTTVDSGFEVVVACDVVEHLTSPGRFLERVRDVLAPEGVLVVTVPNAFSLKRFAVAFLGGKEHVHPDHVAYYSMSTLTELGRRHGWEVMEVHPFTWRNPTWRNRAANGVSEFVMRLARRALLADELAVVLKIVDR